MLRLFGPRFKHRGVRYVTSNIAPSLCVVASLVLQACGERAAPSSPSMDASEVLSANPIAQAISYTSAYMWRQGDPPVHMGSTVSLWYRRACFLTRVSGQLTSSNESVRIERVGNNWYLNGTSSTSGVGAWAHCMIVLEFSPQVSTGVISSPMQLNYGSRWMCFLTEIRGPLDAHSQVVGVDLDQNGWEMANFATSDGGQRVGARCARPTDGDANGNPNLHHQWWLGDDPNGIGSSNGRACMLSNLWGAFIVPDAFVQVTRVFNSWWLYGGNLAPQFFEAGASANCYSG